MKTFRIKFFTKKAGARFENFRFAVSAFGDKAAAFKEGREELIRIARLDQHGDNDQEIEESIHSLQNGGGNSYYYDQTLWTFKVFSKKNEVKE